MLKIVNGATYTFSYQLVAAATSSPLASGVLYPNQIAAYQFDSVPGDQQTAIYCLLTTFLMDGQQKGSRVENDLPLPANATVTIATQIQTGYLRPSG